MRLRMPARWRPAPPVLVDVALALAVAAVTGVTIAASQEPATRAPDALAYTLGAAIGACLLARRRHPLLVLAASTALLMGYYWAGYPAIGVAVPLAVATYTAAAAGQLRAAALLVGGLELFGAGFRALGEDEALLAVLGLGTVADVALLVAVLALGAAVRSRRAWAAEVTERRHRAEREREREAERRVEQERMRIAGELHDVLGHTVAVINVQAGLAVDVLDDAPAQAREPLRAIRARGREAITELEAIVGVLRGRDSREHAPRAPAPDIAQLDELVATTNSPHLRVELSVAGQRRRLPAAVELTAYRIVQESLTNVLRHSGAGAACVRIGYGADAVAVEVTDDGRGVAASQAGSGQGIEGMRERAQAVGGRLAATPVSITHGGFRVYARLPAEQGTAG